MASPSAYQSGGSRDLMCFEPGYENAGSVRSTRDDFKKLRRNFNIAIATVLPKWLGMVSYYVICRDVNSLQQPLVCQYPRWLLDQFRCITSTGLICRNWMGRASDSMVDNLHVYRQSEECFIQAFVTHGQRCEKENRMQRYVS